MTASCRWNSGAAVAVTLLLAACVQQAPSPVAPAPQPVPAVAPQPVPVVAAMPQQATLAPMLERVTPAVVNISVLSRAEVPVSPLLTDPFFRRFFDVPDTPPSRPVVSAGSGVIVDAGRGLVLTNRHVVENAEQIAVTLKDRRVFEAELVGSDAPTDLALLRIDAVGLTPMPIGNSDALRVGDYVVAIGNPFGLGQTVTSGIVSAVGRNGVNPGSYTDFIQTDASINPGNSGGALVDLSGRMIGINTAIVAPAGGNVGIGFAVPSNMASGIMNQLVTVGEVRRGRLGVTIQDVTPSVAEAMNLGGVVGALVTNVEPGSPAARAGIGEGDVILAVDGEPVRDSTDLRNEVGRRTIGTTVELGLVRESRRRTVRVPIESG